MEHNWATLWEQIADTVPDAPALVDGDRRRSWSELDDRGARLAGLLHDAGIGPGSRVALYLYNSAEYIESYVGILKARAVPVNVNYRYVDDELAYLLDNSGAEALVFHASLGPRVARAVARVPSVRLLVEVDDTDEATVAGAVAGAGPGAVAGALSYPQALADVTPAPRRRRSGDDTTMLYTGGTTGLPKGVVSKIGPNVTGIVASVAPMLGISPSIAVDDVPAAAARIVAAGAQIVGLPACPLMHGTGMGIGVIPTLAYGGCVVLLSGHHFSADELWSTIGREKVTWTVIVGDPFARPMLQSLRAGADEDRYDTSSLRIIGSSGAVFSAEVRADLLDLLPQVTILDYIASSEGTMGVAVSRSGHIVPTARFTPAAGVTVFTEDDREVRPGSGERGLVALSVGVPEGYFNDEPKSAATFRLVDGGPLLLSRRLGHGRIRRLGVTARPGIAVHHHRRREGLPPGGRRGHQAPPGRRGLSGLRSPRRAIRSAGDGRGVAVTGGCGHGGRDHRRRRLPAERLQAAEDADPRAGGSPGGQRQGRLPGRHGAGRGRG